jgi:ribosomal protein S18 acetylase RimI-like enzyme
MLLRDVHFGDAEALARLITEFTNLSTTPEQVRQRLANSQNIEHPIVAELAGQLVGFASLRLVHYLGEDTRYAEISELFVSEPYRRQGIARALMNELEVRARAAGVSSIAVLTSTDNHTAVALYQALGFQEFSIALQKWLTQDRPYRASGE